MKTAFVLINCETGTVGPVLDRLKQVDLIRDIMPTSGYYDVIVKLECPETDDYQSDLMFARNKLRRIVDVRSTMTLLVAPERKGN